MQNDPIVGDVRQVREAHSARFNFDLDAIFADLKEQEQRSGRTFVAYPAHRLEDSAAADRERGKSLTHP